MSAWSVFLQRRRCIDERGSSPAIAALTSDVERVEFTAFRILCEAIVVVFM